MSHDSSVGTALGYRLDDRGSRVRFPAEAEIFSLYHLVQNGSGAHPASYPMGTRGSFRGGKVAGMWSCPLISIYFRSQRMSGAVPPLPPYGFMAWCFTFYLVYLNCFDSQLPCQYFVHFDKVLKLWHNFGKIVCWFAVPHDSYRWLNHVLPWFSCWLKWWLTQATRLTTRIVYVNGSLIISNIVAHCPLNGVYLMYGVITNDGSAYINLLIRIAHIICNHYVFDVFGVEPTPETSNILNIHHTRLMPNSRNAFAGGGQPSTSNIREG
jgi:hypothetical protein